MEVGILCHGVLIELHDVRITDSQAGGIEVEVGLFLGGNANTHHGIFLNKISQILELILVVKDGDNLLPAVFTELSYILYVLRALEAVADHIDFLLVHGAVPFQGFHEVKVIGRRCLQVNVVFEGFVEHEGKLRTLGAVAVIVLALVVGFSHGHLEKALCPLDLGRNLGKIGNLEGSTVLLYYLHEIYVIEHQIAVYHHEFILGEVEGLVYKVNVLVFHQCLWF